MIIAIDTGGTKTLIASFGTDGQMSQIAKFPTPANPTEYRDAVAAAVTEAVDLSEVDAVAVAAPGPIRDGQIRRAKNIGPDWSNLDITKLIAEALPGVPHVVAGNDADLAGLSEARSLDPLPTTCLYVTLSTGVGTGLAIDGHLPDSFAHLEGGWMHLMHDGKLEMWEDFASGRNFYERYGQYGSEVDDPDKWRDYAKRASAGLAVLLPMLGPDHVVIGGSMGTHFAKYSQFLRDEVSAILTDFDTSKITQAKYPEEAVIYGCYYYAIDQLGN